MAIAGQSDVFQVDVLGLYARLIEPLGNAMSVRAVIARFPGEIQDRYRFEIHKFVRGLALNKARNEPRAVRLVLADGFNSDASRTGGS